MSSESAIHLERYFSRIGFTGTPSVNLETLRALHLAHVAHIPFENVDVLLGRGIRIDTASVQAKLVDARRGGYCFEQNGLFSRVLEQIGFPITRLSGRVRYGTDRLLPRTHMVLTAEADGRRWLCDVGFGGWGLFEPLELVADRETKQFGWTLSLRREGEAWVLHCAEPFGGQDQYAFTLEPHFPVDYEPANHYCATHPDSRFTQTLVVQRATPKERYFLRNREFVVVNPQSEVCHELPDDAALLKIMAEYFNLSLPPETTFGELPRPLKG